MTPLSDLVHGASQPAFAIDGEMRVLAANAAAEALLGLDSRAVLGRSCFEVMCAVDATGASVCSTGCPVFAQLSSGRPAAPAWSWWAVSEARRLPIRVTTVAMPVDGDESGTVAIVLVQLPHEERALPPGPELVRVQLLGTVGVFRGGRPVVRHRRKTSELLALLASAGPRGMTRDEVLDLLWPEEPFERTGPRLRVLIHELRALLGGASEALVRSGDRLRFASSPRLVLDIAEFESNTRALLRHDAPWPQSLSRLEATLALYRGELAEGEQFGAWVASRREHFGRLHLDLLALGAERFAEAGDLDRAIACCERALRSDPLQERFHLALIVHLVLLGRRGDAFRQYQRCRDVLNAELNASPSKAIVDALEVVIGARRTAPVMLSAERRLARVTNV